MVLEMLWSTRSLRNSTRVHINIFPDHLTLPSIKDATFVHFSVDGPLVGTNGAFVSCRGVCELRTREIDSIMWYRTSKRSAPNNDMKSGRWSDAGEGVGMLRGAGDSLT